MAAYRHTVAEALTEALVKLMSEKKFTDITVTDVVNRAGVSRASFYRNFSSTKDILDSFLDNMVEHFKKNALPVITSQNEQEWRSFLFRYIFFANDHQKELIPGETSNISILLFKITGAAQELSSSHKFENIKEKYSIFSRFTIINSVIINWIMDGQQETPEEIVDYLMSFILTI